MSGFLIAFFITAVLFAAICVYGYYTKYVLGREYQALDTVKELVGTLVFIFFGWWILKRYFNGADSSYGLWLLSFFIGALIDLCIFIVVTAICRSVWKDKAAQEISFVKMSAGLQAALYIFAAICCIFFSLGFLYTLIFKDVFTGVGEIILIALLIALFTYGSYDNIRRTINLLSKK